MVTSLLLNFSILLEELLTSMVRNNDMKIYINIRLILNMYFNNSNVMSFMICNFQILNLKTYSISENFPISYVKNIRINLKYSAIMVGVHKRNVSPQNHFYDIILNGHYIYEIIYLVDFLFSLNTHILLD
jgi:hypothetical protein